jgi:hypothetical protein
MDINTSYYTVLTRILAVKTIALVPLYIYTKIVPPPKANVEFPSPLATVPERKTVSVPRYPSSSDLRFLLTTYNLDIIILYPYTRAGSSWQASLDRSHTRDMLLLLGLLLCGWGYFFFRVSSAVGWSGIRPNWAAAERKHGLWNYPAWSCYYMSYIISGIFIGIGLGFKLACFALSSCMYFGPGLLEVYRQTYVPLYQWIW